MKKKDRLAAVPQKVDWCLDYAAAVVKLRMPAEQNYRLNYLRDGARLAQWKGSFGEE
jgi:hypothetical protein